MVFIVLLCNLLTGFSVTASASAPPARPKNKITWNQLSPAALQIGLEGYQQLLRLKWIRPGALLTLIDLSKASGEERLYVIDPVHKKILLHTIVAHGRHSGSRYADHVSNRPSSYQSSAGFFITKETYNGKNGYSLRLQGLQKGINDQALARGIVVHGASYVDPVRAQQTGWVGRSQGCPAVPVAIHKQLIDLIKDENCLFIYHPTYNANSLQLALGK